MGFEDIKDKDLHEGGVELTPEIVVESKEIKVKQEPIIEYSVIKKIGSEVDKKIKELNLDKLEATEENKTKLKLIRADLKKEATKYETDRKQIKKIVLEPYNAFEEEYKKYIKSKYDDADKLLKDGIDTVESKQKEDIKSEVLAYFAEVMLEKELDDYIKFEDLNINITLSASMKSYKDTIDAYINQVEQDIQVIENHEKKDRLRAKYLKHKNLQTAMIELSEELKLESVVRPTPQAEETSKEEPQLSSNLDETVKVTFTAIASIRLLRELKQFMKEKGIRYE